MGKLCQSLIRRWRDLKPVRVEEYGRDGRVENGGWSCTIFYLWRTIYELSMSTSAKLSWGLDWGCRRVTKGGVWITSMDKRDTCILKFQTPTVVAASRDYLNLASSFGRSTWAQEYLRAHQMPLRPSSFHPHTSSQTISAALPLTPLPTIVTLRILLHSNGRLRTRCRGHQSFQYCCIHARSSEYTC